MIPLMPNALEDIAEGPIKPSPALYAVLSVAIAASSASLAAELYPSNFDPL